MVGRVSKLTKRNVVLNSSYWATNLHELAHDKKKQPELPALNGSDKLLSWIFILPLLHCICSKEMCRERVGREEEKTSVFPDLANVLSIFNEAIKKCSCKDKKTAHYSRSYFRTRLKLRDTFWGRPFSSIVLFCFVVVVLINIAQAAKEKRASQRCWCYRKSKSLIQSWL